MVRRDGSFTRHPTTTSGDNKRTRLIPRYARALCNDAHVRVSG